MEAANPKITLNGPSLPQDQRKRVEATLAPCGHVTALEGHCLALSAYVCVEGHKTEARRDLGGSDERI